MKSHNLVLLVSRGTFISADSRFEDRLSASLSREMRWDTKRDTCLATRFIIAELPSYRCSTIISGCHFPRSFYGQALRRVIIDVPPPSSACYGIFVSDLRHCDIRLHCARSQVHLDESNNPSFTNFSFFLSFLARVFVLVAIFVRLFFPSLKSSLETFCRFGKLRKREMFRWWEW